MGLVVNLRQIVGSSRDKLWNRAETECGIEWKIITGMIGGGSSWKSKSGEFGISCGVEMELVI